MRGLSRDQAGPLDARWPVATTMRSSVSTSESASLVDRGAALSPRGRGRELRRRRHPFARRRAVSTLRPSGAGFDSFVAAGMVGPRRSGRRRRHDSGDARQVPLTAGQLGLSHVEFREGMPEAGDAQHRPVDRVNRRRPAVRRLAATARRARLRRRRDRSADRHLRRRRRRGQGAALRGLRSRVPGEEAGMKRRRR